MTPEMEEYRRLLKLLRRYPAERAERISDPYRKQHDLELIRRIDECLKSPVSESNTRPSAYQTAALPLS